MLVSSPHPTSTVTSPVSGTDGLVSGDNGTFHVFPCRHGVLDVSYTRKRLYPTTGTETHVIVILSSLVTASLTDPSSCNHVSRPLVSVTTVSMIPKGLLGRVFISPYHPFPLTPRDLLETTDVLTSVSEDLPTEEGTVGTV